MITIEAHGHTFTATTNGSIIEISRDGIHAGLGRLNEHGRIVDCAAVLVSDDPEATDDVYTQLDAALCDAAGTIVQGLRSKADRLRDRAARQCTGCPEDDRAYSEEMDEMADRLDAHADAIEAANTNTNKPVRCSK